MWFGCLQVSLLSLIVPFFSQGGFDCPFVFGRFWLSLFPKVVLVLTTENAATKGSSCCLYPYIDIYIYIYVRIYGSGFLLGTLFWLVLKCLEGKPRENRSHLGTPIHQSLCFRSWHMQVASESASAGLLKLSILRATWKLHFWLTYNLRASF